jgi:hypothetical protein
MVVEPNLKKRIKPAPLSKNPGTMKTIIRKRAWPKLLNQAEVNTPPRIATNSPAGNKTDPTSLRPSTLFGRGIHERPRRDTAAPVHPNQ